MKVKVQKYDPSADDAPTMKEYTVDYHEHMTVLEALVKINAEQEPIVFDYSCRGRTCGRCAITFNGTPALACVTCVEENGDNEVKPLTGFPVIRDLIVDKSKVHERVAAIEVRQRAEKMTLEEINKPVDPEICKKIAPLEYCARCCVCTAVCPVVQSKGPKNYIGPTGMIAIGLRYYDPYDEGDRVVQAVQNGLYNCIMCGRCTEVCKALEIDHLSVWKDLRSAAEARGLKPADAS